MIKTYESMSIEIERAVRKAVAYHQQYGLRITVHPNLRSYMRKTGDEEELIKLAKKLKACLEFASSDTLHLNDYELFSTVTQELIEA